MYSQTLIKKKKHWEYAQKVINKIVKVCKGLKH